MNCNMQGTMAYFKELSLNLPAETEQKNYNQDWVRCIMDKITEFYTVIVNNLGKL